MKEKLIKRLSEQWYAVVSSTVPEAEDYRRIRYNAMREFCLDCGLLTFKEIEQLEYEVLTKNKK